MGASKLFERIAGNGPRALRRTVSSNTISKEIRRQKELGTLLSDETYRGSQVRTTNADVWNNIGVQKDIETKEFVYFLPDEAHTGQVIRPRTGGIL